MLNRSLAAALAAEAIGTFLFFVIGAGAVIVNAQTGGEVGLLGIALAHGLALTVLATGFGPISGAQFNPAVTVALWLVGRKGTMVSLPQSEQVVGCISRGPRGARGAP